MKLNFGCGPQVTDGWIGVDYAIGARFAKLPLFRTVNRKLRIFDLDWDDRITIHDLTKRLPWKDDSADVVYTSHVLEHLARDDGRNFLAECHRVLRKGGIVRVVVPDLNPIVREYVDGRLRADEVLEKLGVLYISSRNPIKRGLSRFVQSPHQCLYDTPTVLSLLREIGFDARSRRPFDSEIEDIRKVELEGRTDDAVIVEGRKL